MSVSIKALMLYLGRMHASICKILYNKIKNMDTYGKWLGTIT